ncbi:MAG: chromosomal replication initiator protein DnaA, partial [Chloroflexi bacterium]|nr:chromosomal replication initiator protein DnaA [Chloroflexota bacterium]
MNPPYAWETVKAQLQAEMPNASFDTWVKDAHFVQYEQDTFTIGSANAYARDWLAARLTATITR